MASVVSLVPKPRHNTLLCTSTRWRAKKRAIFINNIKLIAILLFFPVTTAAAEYSYSEISKNRLRNLPGDLSLSKCMRACCVRVQPALMTKNKGLMYFFSDRNLNKILIKYHSYLLSGVIDALGQEIFFCRNPNYDYTVLIDQQMNFRFNVNLKKK